MATFEIHVVGWSDAKLVEMNISDNDTDKERRTEFLRICDELNAHPNNVTRLVEIDNRREWINLFR